MKTEIIIALITAAGSGLALAIFNFFSHRKLRLDFIKANEEGEVLKHSRLKVTQCGEKLIMKLSRLIIALESYHFYYESVKNEYELLKEKLKPDIEYEDESLKFKLEERIDEINNSFKEKSEEVAYAVSSLYSYILESSLYIRWDDKDAVIKTLKTLMQPGIPYDMDELILKLTNIHAKISKIFNKKYVVEDFLETS